MASSSSDLPVQPLVPVNKRVIVFDEDGVPALTTQPVLTKSHLQSLYMVVAAQPYVCDDPLSPDFGKYDGMTVAEVMVRKQLEAAAKGGDIHDIETVMDRLLGKPERFEKRVEMQVSYEDFLKGLAAGAAPVDAPVDVPDLGDLG